VDHRVAQIEINLERWRWLPVDLGQRHIIVNIPAYHLDLYEDGARVLELRVVVGKSYRRTPVFSDTMRYLVLNPYWEVPPSIAVHDKLPLLRKDPAALVAAGFRVFRGFGADAEQVDPLRVDWNSVSPRQFSYRLRQDPGPKNALGQVKFMFPNRFNVYLHDTPSRDLFAHADRSFSSGCIRVEDPVRLATAVLAGTPGWDAAALRAGLDTGQTRTVSLGRPVRVHLLYWTAWVDDDGTVEFRRDLYGRDERVLRALDTPPPDATPAEERPS
jgi:murein L,D-transpeptidase YcbB/YkuD